MLVVHILIAAVAAVALAARPRSNGSAAIVAAAALLDLILGAHAGVALRVVAPLVIFLTAALTLSAMVVDAGLADRAAGALARLARGHGGALYALVCVTCALLTAVVSLDGAVVLMVPLALALQRRCNIALAPLLLGIVAVANAASIAVPQGNPTNLVVISHLHITAVAFIERMLLPGAVAALLCATLVAISERASMRARYTPPPATAQTDARGHLPAGVALAAAALTAWLAPIAGVEPWYPFAAVVAISVVLLRRFTEISVPWRVAVQIAGLAVVVEALGLHPPSTHSSALPLLLAIALGVSVAAAMINNLPASVWAASLLSGAGPVAYSASLGLAVGALAVPHGSVATLIAADLAGPEDRHFTVRRLAPMTLAALIAATLLLRLTV
ncbi:MAG TPA: SLC13 family permease [Solirubrobacteraceae bacterium]|nr:SLC13 family permease [Solirubrobacteraceae bacterium]